MQGQAEIIIKENESRNSRLISLYEILKHKFIIPIYQRPYAWSQVNFQELLATIKESKEQELPAFFGSIIVAENVAKTMTNEYMLIDGQQRLTSFLVLLKLVKGKLQQQLEEIAEREQQHEVNRGDKKTYKEIILRGNSIEKIQNTVNTVLSNHDRLIRERSGARRSDKKFAVENDILGYIFHDKPLASSDLKKIPKIFENWWDNVVNDDSIEHAEFILERSQFCFLVVQGKLSEDYAIDIFNTLNATGEPLTAFEILKSITYKKTTNREDDPDNQETIRLAEIENDLRRINMKKVKQTKYTDRLLLFLSMMYESIHEKNLTTFRSKRDFLNKIKKDHSESIPEFVNTIYDLHKFTIENWEGSKAHRLLFKQNNEQEICFDFLQAMGHDRTLPILFKFKEEESEDVVKACVAFTCLWRGVAADAGTDRIDHQYKEISEYIYQCDANVAQLKNKLREHLRQRWKNNREFSRATWVEEFAGVNLYKKIKFARFMLFIAFHESIFDRDKLIRSKLKFLTTDNYYGDDYKTIEHIVPNSYRTINKPGNLILLPRAINSKVGKKNFTDKRGIYQNCLVKHRKEGDDLPYVRVLREIVSYDDNDTDEKGYLSDKAIAIRGQRLGNSIWDTLAEDWLDWEKTS